MNRELVDNVSLYSRVGGGAMEQTGATNWQLVLSMATVGAVPVGPILAVLVTRWVDDRRAKQFRRWEIFRTLMRTRRSQTSGDFVAALNLVEVEFLHRPQVVARAREFIAIWNRPPPADLDGWQRLLADRDITLARLLDAMARSLGVSLEQVDIMTGGYAPKGWQDQEEEQRHLRQGFINVLAGRAALPVRIDVAGRQDGPGEPSLPLGPSSGPGTGGDS